MPKSTFYNLSQDRKNSITGICYEEFAKRGYDRASISRIVRKLNIAKGSFYRYFESKEELYQYLMDQATALKHEHVKEPFELHSPDFFLRLEQHLIQTIQFDQAFPLQSAFLYTAMRDSHNEGTGAEGSRINELQTELLSPLVKKYQQKGALRKDISSDIIAYASVQALAAIHSFLMHQSIRDFRNHISEPKLAISGTEQDINSTVQEFSRLLAEGISQR